MSGPGGAPGLSLSRQAVGKGGPGQAALTMCPCADGLAWACPACVCAVCGLQVLQHPWMKEHGLATDEFIPEVLTRMRQFTQVGDEGGQRGGAAAGDGGSELVWAACGVGRSAPGGLAALRRGFSSLVTSS